MKLEIKNTIWGTCLTREFFIDGVPYKEYLESKLK